MRKSDGAQSESFWLSANFEKAFWLSFTRVFDLVIVVCLISFDLALEISLELCCARFFAKDERSDVLFVRRAVCLSVSVLRKLESFEIFELSLRSCFELIDRCRKCEKALFPSTFGKHLVLVRKRATAFAGLFIRWQ